MGFLETCIDKADEQLSAAILYAKRADTSQVHNLHITIGDLSSKIIALRAIAATNELKDGGNLTEVAERYGLSPHKLHEIRTGPPRS